MKLLPPRMRIFLAASISLLPIVSAQARALMGDCRSRPARDSGAESSLRVVAVMAGHDDPEVMRSVRETGANAVATSGTPSAVAAAAAESAGLRYIPFLPTRDVERLLTDEAFLLQVRGIPNLFGFQYRDTDTVEGYTSAETQQRAYGILKALFSGALVLHATRLDLVMSDPTFLDRFFRPEFTDRVTPYFYPVGTTVLGTQKESDPWDDRLFSLLAPLAARMPAGKGVLPVLQAFEQIGYPVGRAFAARQLDVYRRLWPDNTDVAAFWWGGEDGGPLRGMSEAPALLDGFRLLFGGAPSQARPCVASRRGAAP